MTRTINVNAHDLPETDFDRLVEDVRIAVEHARKAPNGSSVTGTVYDSHGPHAGKSRDILTIVSAPAPEPTDAESKSPYG